MPRWKRVIRHGTRHLAPYRKQYRPFLVRMMRLWSCGQPRSDALSAQAAPEGVVHKSTGVLPDIALRNGMQWGGP